MSYTLHTDVPWDQTMRQLRGCFDKWGVIQWNVWPKRVSDTRNDARVVVEFAHPKGRTVSLTMDKQWEGRDNLRVLYLALDAMRLNEKRGIGDVLGEAYLQLAASEEARDPYEILGIRPDAPEAVIEASYRGLAKERHPDKGGTAEAFKELQDAYERITKERKA